MRKHDDDMTDTSFACDTKSQTSFPICRESEANLDKPSVSLNYRFANDIEQVRALEDENKTLRSRITELESSSSNETSLRRVYEDELSKLRKLIITLNYNKATVEIELHNCVQDLETTKKQLEVKMSAHKETEDLVKSLRKELDEAALIRVGLEKKVEILQRQLDFLHASNNEEPEALQFQFSVDDVKHHCFTPVPPNVVTDSSRKILEAYERFAIKNITNMDKLHQSHIADLQRQIKVSNQKIMQERIELLETRKLLRDVTTELQQLRINNSSLESQISTSRRIHAEDNKRHMRRISGLEAKLQQKHDQLRRILEEFKELVAVKVSLDLEIVTYRNLLQGEERRIEESARPDQKEWNKEDSPARRKMCQPSINKPEKLLTDENPVVGKTSRPSKLDCKENQNNATIETQNKVIGCDTFAAEQRFLEDDVLNLTIEGTKVDIVPENCNADGSAPTYRCLFGRSSVGDLV